MASTASTTTSEPRESATRLVKLKPTAKMPTAAVLNQLSDFDRRLLAQRLEETAEAIIDADLFATADVEQRLLGSWTGEPAGEAAGNDDSGFHALSSAQSLSTEQEQHLFQRYNYCRSRVLEVLSGFADRRLTADATRKLLRWEHQVREMRGEIVRLNMPLVLAMAKRTRITGVDHAELISEGNLALLRSVEKFDCTRGFKFSTYACRAILKSFSRVATKTSRYRGYFPVEFDPTLEKSDHMATKRDNVEADCVDELKSILGRNLARLSDTEATVIKARFALDEHAPVRGGNGRGKTLEQVGEIIGVTKERVRQIQNKALGKLKTVLEDAVLAR